ncbi:MAG: hypothetical protein JWN31_1489, partial [Frankiales bacterium]|nr:hypothetical protein [Frankiales bacterium]
NTGVVDPTDATPDDNTSSVTTGVTPFTGGGGTVVGTAGGGGGAVEGPLTLPRTGASLSDWTTLAASLLTVGFVLVLRTRRSATTPVGRHASS